MDEEREPTTDELWDQHTSETDEAVVATTDDIPDDDSDLLGNDDAETPSPVAPAFDVEAYYPQFVERFQREVAPQIQSQAVEEAMRRMKMSNKQRDENIKAQLAPLVDQLKELEEQGVYTREDSQRAYAKRYQSVASETEARERAQQNAETRQRWLQSQAQQTPVPSERPIYVTSTEARMNQILEQSGLSENDPEFKSVPLSITHPDPNEAVDYFKVKVESAVKARNQRLQTNAKPKPFIDMGTGGGAGQGNSLAGIEDLDQLWEMSQRS
jgi:hypothetical protein